MPYRAAHQCSTPGCPRRVTHPGKCSDHRAEVQRLTDLARGTATERGYGAAWRKRRDLYLAENPYCVQCWSEGHEVQAQQVDHIVPKRLGGADDESNWQPLCDHHHSVKTARDNGGFGNGRR